MIRPVLALLPLACAVLGCTLVLSPGEVQCETTAECEERGFLESACLENVCVEAAVIDPVWGCLGNVSEPTPDPEQRVELGVRLIFAIGDAPLTSGTVDICDKLDINCADDDPDFPKGLTPDATGLVQVSLRQGFDGFVRLSDPQIVDSRIYVGRPIVEPPTIKEIQLLRPGDYEALASLALSEPDPTRGTAILLGVDCQGEGASGIRFETPNADGDTAQFYLINQAPTLPPNATETDADGFGGFYNLAPNPAVARSFRAVDDVYIGESSFQILPNTISYVLIAPTPE